MSKYIYAFIFLAFSFSFLNSYSSSPISGITFNVTLCEEVSSVKITGPTWGWSPVACPPLSDNGDGTWSITFDPIPPFLNTDFEYLFVADGVLEDMVSSNLISENWSCTPNTDSISYAYRLWSPGSDETVNAYFNTCDDCSALSSGCTDTLACNYDPAALIDDGSCLMNYGCMDVGAFNYDSLATCDDSDACLYEYNVTFQLDLRGQTNLTYTTPEVNGTFNNWCGSCAEMTDIDNDSIWEITIPILEGSGPTAGTPGWEYKFSADNWNIEEGLFEGDPCTYSAFGYTNRYLLVTQDTVLDPVCWESCVDCLGPQSSYDVTFRLDMTNTSDFNTPEVNGTFNEWCGSCWPMSDDDSDGIWEFTTAVDTSFHEFKFSADNWGIQEQLDTSLNCVIYLQDSSETIFVNRYLQIQSDTVLDIVCWNDCVECQQEVVDSTFKCEPITGCVYAGDNPSQPGEYNSIAECEEQCNNSNSLDELGTSNVVSVFPNPSSGIFNVVSHQFINQIVVYNKLGSQLLVLNDPETTTEIDLSNIHTELFFVEIYYKDKVVRQKLLNLK